MTDRKGPADPNFERKLTAHHPALGAPYSPQSTGSVIWFPEMASDPYRAVADWLEQSNDDEKRPTCWCSGVCNEGGTCAVYPNGKPGVEPNPRANDPVEHGTGMSSYEASGMNFDASTLTLYAPNAVKLSAPADLANLAKAREAHNRLYGYVPDDGYEPRYVPIGEPTMPRSYHNSATVHLFSALNSGEARLQRMDDGMEARADAAAVKAQQAYNKMVRESLIRELDGFTDADRPKNKPDVGQLIDHAIFLFVVTLIGAMLGRMFGGAVSGWFGL